MITFPLRWSAASMNGANTSLGYVAAKSHNWERFNRSVMQSWRTWISISKNIDIRSHLFHRIFEYVGSIFFWESDHRRKFIFGYKVWYFWSSELTICTKERLVCQSIILWKFWSRNNLLGFILMKLTKTKMVMISCHPLQLQHDQGRLFDLWVDLEKPCNLSISSLIEVDINMLLCHRSKLLALRTLSTL